MQVLEAHGRTPRRGLPWIVGLTVLLVVVIVAVVSLSGGGGGKGATGTHGGGGAATGPTKKGNTASDHHHTTPTFDLVSSTPTSGASGVASNADLTITFSDPVSLGSARPTLTPTVAGTWVQDASDSIRFDAAAPFIPEQTEHVTVPGGKTGLRADNGAELASSTTVTFTTAIGDELRLQQLLGELNYLPLSFTSTGPATAANDAAMPQTGTFAWRWSTLPASLTSLWTQGEYNEIQKAAVMTFENHNNLTVDGIAGPAVWSGLLNSVASHTIDTAAYNYVSVSKVQPENLTLYSNGAVVYSGVLINSGAPGADTQDGTFAVFEHVTSSEMKGTNPDGSKYDDPDVPWASYFNGGDALHGFVRAHYGYPQSNGCIEMPVATAGMIWPYTPIGTMVTISGPSSGAGPTPTTTTTTTAPVATTTTTTAPPPPVTTTTPTTAPTVL
ncbi:MAG TPA: L,D-transpeptidase family protein [Acidimicrobiales bacterium]